MECLVNGLFKGLMDPGLQGVLNSLRKAFKMLVKSFKGLGMPLKGFKGLMETLGATESYLEFLGASGSPWAPWARRPGGPGKHKRAMGGDA